MDISVPVRLNPLAYHGGHARKALGTNMVW